MDECSPEGPETLPPETAAQPVIVPIECLSDEALWSLAREALLRQMGSDDPGDRDLERDTRSLLASLRAGGHVVTFDPVTDSAGVIKRDS